MLTFLKCPDGQSVPVKDCLLGGCRMGSRCLTLPTLTLIAKERVWSGTPSTTQLLNGTMQEFLKLTKPYTIDPQDRLFALLGTYHHQRLEDVAKALGLPSEIPLTEEDKDIFDLLEPENSSWVLTDYKTWGSYRVAKALGVVATGKQPNSLGEVYKTSGAWGKAGSPKMVTVFQRDSEKADLTESELQLNRYRVLLSKRGVPVSRMQLQITVRDGGLAAAQSRGVTQRGYVVAIRSLPDDIVQQYFATKASNLKAALEKGNWGTPCTPAECWDGNKCQGYCEVAEFCSYKNNEAKKEAI